MYIYPFRRPQAFHSRRIQSANSSINSNPAPLTAAAIPSVPGQAANTPAASFIPKTTSPFSLREFDATLTGTQCGHSSATACSWLSQSVISSAVALARRIKCLENHSFKSVVVPGRYCSPKIVFPRNSASSSTPLSSKITSFGAIAAIGPVTGYFPIRQSEINNCAIFSSVLSTFTYASARSFAGSLQSS